MMEADHERLARRQVVLLGIGHTNAHVLRMWRMNRDPDAALTCLSDYSVATYSGMLPAVLAGQIPQSQMQIDLVRLCSANGARLLTNRVTGLDLKKNEVLFADRPAVPFDVLSIGIGSRPTMKGVVVESESLLTIKPMQTFVERLTAFVSRFLINTASASPPPPLEVIVVGAGVAGVEITCCLPGFLKSILDGREFQLTLATSADKILPDAKPGTRRRVRRELDRRRVQLLTDHRVIGVNDQRVAFGSGETREFDLVVWATGATAPPLLSELGLPLDDRGFLATRDTLRTVADLPIYAVGDTGSMVEHQVPKSGVYAVRQGPILWENLRRELDGRPLKRYDPQSTFMRLINLGDGRAVGQWRGISFEGKWVKWWKDYIDQKFMDKFIPHVMAEDADDPMQCRGCGCKLGGVSLESALGALGSANIVKDDAAEIGDESNPMVASTDFFTSPVADSYLTGRIAALHSASDLIAMGADVRHALAKGPAASSIRWEP